jgi:hypothetical protein
MELEMNKLSESLRENGHHTVILESFERVQFQGLVDYPGLGLGIHYLTIDSQIVTVMDIELFEMISNEGLIQNNRSRTYYVYWTTHLWQKMAIAYLEVFDDEILLLIERFFNLKMPPLQKF